MNLTNCPYGYRPYIDNSINALNPCFLSLLKLIQGVLFLLIGSFQLVQLIQESRTPTRIRYFSVTTKFLLQLSNVVLQGGLAGCELVMVCNRAETSPSVLRYSALVHLLFVLFVSLPTDYLQYFKSTSAKGSQIFYYLSQIAVFALQLTLRFIMYPDDRFNLIKGQPGTIIEIMILFNSTIILMNYTYFYESSPELDSYFSEKHLTRDINVLQNVTFSWMNKLIVETYKLGRISDPRNIPYPPADLKIESVSQRLRAKWESEKWKGRNSLFRALVKSFGPSILIAMSYEIVKDLLSIIQPQFLRIFIICFSDNIIQKYPPLHGYFIALGLFMISVLTTFLQNQFFINIFEVGLGMKGSLIALTYQKSLKLSLDSREEKSTGDILNMASTDVNKIQKFFEDCQTIVGAPIQLIGVLISLYWLLGKAILAGLATMMIMIPVNTFLSKKVEKLYKTQMGYKDSRIKVTNEILSSIKSIKLYSWEEPMLARLNHIRNDLEIQNFKKIGVLSNLIFFLWNSVPLIVTCSTFGIFSWLSDVPLSPQIVFPSLTLFDILNDVIYSLPNTINSIIETKVSMNRLGEFLLNEELDDSFLFVEQNPTDNMEPVVEIKNATFLWKPLPQQISDADMESEIESPKVAIANVNGFKVSKDSLTCIVGRVGAGKSTLLKSILGQLPCVSAANTSSNPEVIQRASSIAYCSQQPWIVNATIKENILFGHRYDECFYRATVDACQLLADFKVLPDGDETLVGEKGISLSGGQKARVSLARAVYARADLYILDDILSAVDAEVRNKIISKVLDRQYGLLKNKTVVLATNTIAVLKHSKMIYVMQRGSLIEHGTYEDGLEIGKLPILNKLLNDFDSNFKESSGASDKKESSSGEQILPSHGDGELTTSLESGIVNEGVTDKIISRRASIETFKAPNLGVFEDMKGAPNPHVEKTEQGRVKFSIYIFYVRACGILGCLLFFCFMILSRILDLLENFWLKRWSEHNSENGSNQDVFKFVAIYALIGLGSAAFNNLRSIIMLLFCSIKASIKLHDTMAKAVLRAPMTFFETTPIGRILNRFSSDIQAVDSNLQFMFSFFFRSVFNYILTVILISYNMPMFLVFNFFLLLIYLYYQTYYITLCRELKRLTSISVSPIMSLFGESLAGHMVINAFNQFDRFNFLNLWNVQYNINCNFHLRSTNRWLSLRLQTIGSLTVLATAMLALLTMKTSHKMSPGMIGLLMNYALQVTSSLMWIVRMSVQIETNIVSVERIHEYCELPSEAPAIVEENRAEITWPSEGKIVFSNYSTRYREGLPPVLRNLNMEIRPQEKIGIVGRTGAGKSTLSLALFRILEAIEGSIIIDGVDISSIGLSDLRRHLGIIPQEAEAFEGTIRTNLDPFNQYSDDEIYRAIELSHLKPHIQRMLKNSDSQLQSLEGNALLDANVKGSGANLSAGERQLLCLSRALLNKSKVLIFDEATAAVDMETDRIIQKTIREEFKNRTILTIAHRLETILDCDRILVLDQGEIKEFDTPANLLSNEHSVFYALHQNDI